MAAACGGDDGGSTPRDSGPAQDAEIAADADAALAPLACDVVAPRECPDSMPRYPDVAPIFAKRCATCHNGQDGHWPLSTYQHVADWYGEIRAQMLACTMPPVDSGVSMPVSERQLILSWIRCGFPK